MGKTTDELVKMAHQASPHSNRRELDMLLTIERELPASFSHGGGWAEPVE
jgi:aspartate kinase